MEARAGQIAEHYEQAGLDDRAIPFHERAAAWPQNVSPMNGYPPLPRGVSALWTRRQPSPERDRHELRLRHAISAPLNARYGFASTVLEGELDPLSGACAALGDTRLEHSVGRACFRRTWCRAGWRRPTRSRGVRLTPAVTNLRSWVRRTSPSQAAPRCWAA